MKKLYAFLCVSFFACFQLLFAEVIQVADLNLLEGEFAHLDAHSLVLFDVDHTLIQPKDAILRKPAEALAQKYIQAILGNPVFAPPNKYAEGYLLSKALLQMQFELVDAKTPSLIKKLHQKGIKTIALTAANTGPFGVISSMENWRIQQLRKLGIDFSSAFPRFPLLTFEQYKKNHSLPLFKDGVLFSINTTKGAILTEFLKKIDWVPRRVVFIDDRLEYIQSVDLALQKMGIQFLGLHYIAAESQAIPVDAKLGEFQFRHLAEHGEWLSDVEAKSLKLREDNPTVEKMIPVQDGNLYCLAIGKGEPIFVLHGGPGMNHTYLLPQMEALVDGSHQVIFYDQRGCGQSTGEMRSDLITLDQYVEDLESLRKAFGFSKITVLGHSWGGLLALNYAIKYPERLNSLIVMDAIPATGENCQAFVVRAAQLFEPLMPQFQEIMANPLFIQGDAVLLNKYFRLLFSAYCTKPEDAEKITLQFKENKNVLKINQIFNETLFNTDYDFLDGLHKVLCPVLVVHGAADPIPLRAAEEIHKNVKNGKLVIFEDAGHFPYVEQPEKLFDAIHKFLNKT